ncbi:MAG TPA: flavodoxin domain-containing protein [Ktedonobacterales bacterium]
MNTLIVYDSQYGNTERIAQALAGILREYGQVQAMRVDPAQPIDLQGTKLLIIGSPTQGWRSTPAMQSFLKRLSREQLRGVAVAAFDTRFQKPRWLTGSAATHIAKAFQRIGISPLVPPESFFVDGKEGPLLAGEQDRAATWARMLDKMVEAPQPATP